MDQSNIFTVAIAYIKEVINQRAEVDLSFLDRAVNKFLEFFNPDLPKDKLIIKLSGAPLDRLNNNELVRLFTRLSLDISNNL
ncbi:MAG: hypothetical protein WCN27_02715 [Alphaproteobacteria bacterium]